MDNAILFAKLKVNLLETRKALEQVKEKCPEVGELQFLTHLTDNSILVLDTIIADSSVDDGKITKEEMSLIQKKELDMTDKEDV